MPESEEAAGDGAGACSGTSRPAEGGGAGRRAAVKTWRSYYDLVREMRDPLWRATAQNQSPPRDPFIRVVHQVYYPAPSDLADAFPGCR